MWERTFAFLKILHKNFLTVDAQLLISASATSGLPGRLSPVIHKVDYHIVGLNHSLFSKLLVKLLSFFD